MHKRYIKLMIVVLVFLTFPVHAYSQDTPDTEPPTGYFVTGMEGTIPTGPTFGLVGLYFSDNVGIVETTVYINDKPIKNGDLGITYSTEPWLEGYRFNMNLTNVSGGKYKTQIEIKDAAGNKAWVLTSSKHENYIIIAVDGPTNNVVTPAPETPTPVASSKCTVSQTEVDAIVNRISERAEKQAAYLYKAHQQIEEYSESLGTTSPERSIKLSDAASAYTRVQQLLLDLKASSISCSEDPKSDLDNFKNTLDELKSALVSYRENIQILVSEVYEKD